MTLRRSLLALSPLLAAACAGHAAPATDPEPVDGAAPVAVATGDACEAARARLAAEPGLMVDRPPAPIEMKPPLFQRVPRTALRKDGSADVKANVLVDTLGRADVKSLQVVAASHAWFVTDLRRVLPQWKFTPAELGSCKVPGLYHIAGGIKPRPAPPPAKRPATRPRG